MKYRVLCDFRMETLGRNTAGRIGSDPVQEMPTVLKELLKVVLVINCAYGFSPGSLVRAVQTLVLPLPPSAGWMVHFAT
jgi:hypothetical protein